MYYFVKDICGITETQRTEDVNLFTAVVDRRKRKVADRRTPGTCGRCCLSYCNHWNMQVALVKRDLTGYYGYKSTVNAQAVL